jgi:hypothetical protein
VPEVNTRPIFRRKLAKSGHPESDQDNECFLLSGIFYHSNCCLLIGGKNEFVGSLENGDFCPIEAKVRQKSNFAQIF